MVVEIKYVTEEQLFNIWLEKCAGNPYTFFWSFEALKKVVLTNNFTETQNENGKLKQVNIQLV